MPDSTKKPLVIFIYAALILSTLLVYWQVRYFDFVNYDDDTYVYGNQHVSSGLSRDGVVWAFTTGHASFWHPVTWLSLMLDCQLFGPNSGSIHFVSVLLHLVNTLLLFTVLKKMTGVLWPSAFVAAAFALHPMHVESVAWIAERKDVLSTFFLLLTLAAYAGYVKRPSAFRYIAALTIFAVGLMAKPMLITLPFMLLLLDYWPLNRFGTQSRNHNGRAALIIEKIPFFVLAIVFSVITFVTQKAGGGVLDIKAIPLSDRVGNAFISYATYISKMFWPQGLAAHYPPNAVGSIPMGQVALSALLMVGVSLLVLRFWGNRKYLTVGWLWFVATLLPVIGLIQFTGSAYADRFTYIPYIGLFIMIAWGLPELLPKWPYLKYAFGISGVVALAALGICAHQQVSYWKDSVTLFSHATLVTQCNDIAYSNRGAAYGKLGKWQEALQDCTEAITIKPDGAEAYSNRGAVYINLGRVVEAIGDCSQAIKIKPDCAEAYKNRGIANGKLGRHAEAIEDLSKAIEIGPDNAEARFSLAGELAGQGRWDEAVSQYRAVLKVKPNWADAMNNLALIIAINPNIKDRDMNEAVRLARVACESANYRNAAFLGTLAAAQASAGRFSEAVDTANKAISLADTANQLQLKGMIQHHLSFYTQGKPYIEPTRTEANRP